MKTKLKFIWNLLRNIAPVLVVILLFLMVKNCSDREQERTDDSNNLLALHADITDLELSNGELAHEKSLFEVSKEEMRKEIWMKVDDTIKALLKKIKNPVVITKIKTEYKIPAGYVPFTEPIPYDFSRTFQKDDQWYSISGTVNQNGFDFNDISIFNTQRLVIGYKKNQLTARITNSNPHITTTDIEGQVISPNKKRFVMGVGGTIDVLGRPSFGLFLGYKLFEF